MANGECKFPRGATELGQGHGGGVLRGVKFLRSFDVVLVEFQEQFRVPDAFGPEFMVAKLDQERAGESLDWCCHVLDWFTVMSRKSQVPASLSNRETPPCVDR